MYSTFSASENDGSSLGTTPFATASVNLARKFAAVADDGSSPSSFSTLRNLASSWFSYSPKSSRASFSLCSAASRPRAAISRVVSCVNPASTLMFSMGRKNAWNR